MTQKRDKASRWIDDEYQVEGVRGKQWDLTGKLKPLVGVYNSTLPTYASGEAGFVQLDSRGRLMIGADLEVNIGNVGILNAAEGEIDPSEAQAANTAYAAADKLTPIGGVKSATRHTAAELETFADDDYVPVGVTDVHELRVRDDDANTDLNTLITDAQAANTPYVAADRVTPLGGVKSATRHTAVELETFADDDWVPVGVTAVHELRVRDDDTNTVLGTIDSDTNTIQSDTTAMKADLNELTAAPVAKVPVGMAIALAGSPAPIALTAADATAIYLQAARADGDNTGNVFIGIVADLVSGTKNYVKLVPGATWQYVCRPGTKVAMATFGIDGETATDGVIGYYEPV